jgi:hypothetical protein
LRCGPSARADQQATRARERAQQRAEAEEGGAGEEHAPAPEQVGEPPAEQQKAAKGDRVRVHDPLQPGRAEVQPIANRRQRDVHDRDVEDHHELREAEQHEQHVRTLSRARGAVGEVRGAGQPAKGGGGHRRIASWT